MPKKADNTIKAYREIMKGITLEEIIFPSLQSNADKYRKFCKFCHLTYNDSFFQLISKQLLLQQISKTAVDATSYDELQFGRAVVNGLALYEEMFKKYSLEFESKYMPRKDEFDNTKSFESVN